MNSRDIDRALRGDAHCSRYFEGVYSYEEMVRRFACSDDDVKMYVFNTHPSLKPGEHWIAVVTRGRVAYYFDSFGRHPDVYAALANEFRLQCRRVYYNNTLLQNLSSTACGDYCVLFCLLSARGWSLQRFVNWLSSFDLSETRDHTLRRLLIEMYGDDFHSSYRQNRRGLVGVDKLHNVVGLRAIGERCDYDKKIK